MERVFSCLSLHHFSSQSFDICTGVLWKKGITNIFINWVKHIHNHLLSLMPNLLAVTFFRNIGAAVQCIGAIIIKYFMFKILQSSSIIKAVFGENSKMFISTIDNIRNVFKLQSKKCTYTFSLVHGRICFKRKFLLFLFFAVLLTITCFWIKITSHKIINSKIDVKNVIRPSALRHDNKEIEDKI